ncbi:response regulator [Pantoea sp. Taur]|uniref:response regulator n=1 Tax=Pantoea sp. Taur TaxID=2576757 RepID=UPI001352D0E2|nr:transporter substrate-binding domain-containing protein [Pantoea sp. Taur]MXP57137.1 transporter substrate-binding domain-containing protein [Pantoea sp. Taur]
MNLLASLITGLMLLLGLPALLQAETQPLALLPRVEINPPALDFSPEVNAWLETHPVIDVGIWGISQPPISQGLERGQLAGIDADYLAVIESTLNVHFRLQHYRGRDEALAALSRGDITMLAVWNPALDKWNQVKASLPWLHDRSVMVTSAQRGNSALPLENDLLTMLDDVNPLPHEPHGESPFGFQDYQHAINSVAFGQSRSVVMNHATARFLTRNRQVENIWLVPHPTQSDINLSFGVSKNAPELLSAVDEVLQHLPMVSRLRIAQGWGLDQDNLAGIKPLALSASERDWLRSHPPLTVLVDARRAPFSYVNSRGQPDGLAVNVLQLFTERYGLQFNYKVAHSDREMMQLIIRHPDAILTQMLSVPGEAETAQPAGQVTLPWLVTPAVLMMVRDSTRPATLHDLSGERIAVSRRSPLLPWLKTWYPMVQWVESDSVTQALDWLDHTRVRGVVSSQFAAQYYQRYQQENRLYPALALPVRPFNASFAVANNDPTLLAILNRALQQTTPQTLLKIAESWRSAPHHESQPLTSLPSVRTLAMVLAGVLSVALAVAFWIGFLRQKLRALAENLHHRQTLIEQLQDAREETAQVLKSRSAFMKSMSHEVRTPLNAMIGLMELEMARHQAKGSYNENLQTAYESACSLLTLTSDMFDIFRAEHDDTDAAIRVVNLPSLVHSTVALYRQQAEEQGLTISTGIEIDTPRMECDPLLIIRVLSSLLRNAIKHAACGEIKVALCQLAAPGKSGVPLVMEVSNAGAAVHPATSSAHDGADTGFSLAGCARLAAATGATLTVDTYRKQGMLVSLHFSAKPIAFKSLTPIMPDAKPGTVLIVDDYPPACLLLSQLLHKLGQRVLTAHNGREGLALWQQYRQQITAVITDCTMPEMDGFAMTRAIRAAEQKTGCTPLPIYGLTALSQQEVTDAGTDSGMNACLTKPLSPDQLQQLLHPQKSTTETQPGALCAPV